MGEIQALETYKGPFPWFGGKSRVAHLVWERFGEVANYVEPFFGSGATLFLRPDPITGTETVNDADGFVCNFWRALAADPEELAHYADWPVNENDLHARHAYLKPMRAELARRMECDPDYCDAKIAGWWVWGISCWIGSGWCSADGPWVVEDGQLVRRPKSEGTWRSRPHLSSEGQGVNTGTIRQIKGIRSLEVDGIERKRPKLVGGAGGSDLETASAGIVKKRPLLNDGAGVHRHRPHIGRPEGVSRSDDLLAYFQMLAARLRRVRVCCGDWTRVMGPSPTYFNGCTAVFLDPPYSHDVRDDRLYGHESDCAKDCAEWARQNGDNPLLRIALCGYEGEHEMPGDWECIEWKAQGGYSALGDARGKSNRHKERIWFSPHCVRPHEEVFKGWTGQ